MGGGKAGSVARSRAVNLTLIVIYKGKVRRTWRTTGFIHVNISVPRYFEFWPYAIFWYESCAILYT